MMKGKKRIKWRVGDIVGIPLSNGSFAYARAYRGASLAVYAYMTGSLIADPPVADVRVAFHAWCVTKPIENGQWPIVGYLPFPHAADAEPPPQFIQDLIDPTQFRIMYKGDVRDATAEEVKV